MHKTKFSDIKDCAAQKERMRQSYYRTLADSVMIKEEKLSYSENFWKATLNGMKSGHKSA
jgi:hypothetical protein